MQRCRSGTQRALTAIAATLLAGSMVAGCGSDTEAPEGGDETVSAAGISLPETPAGQQVSWFLEASSQPPIPPDEFTERMSPEFLAEISPEVINEVLMAVGPLEPTEVQSATDDAIVVSINSADGQLTLTLRVNDDGMIDTLNLAPALNIPDAPESWGSLTERLESLAPEASFIAARLNDDGACESAHDVRADDVMPIASMFKVYVLEAVQRAIDAGDLTWESTIAVTEDNRSWPTGFLQDEEPGTEVTVAEAAGLMISFSDNTASDMLLEAVGREAVEEVVAETSANADANRPMLTTQEMFKLKIVDYPQLADQFSGGGEAERRSLLNTTVADTPLPELAAAEPWTSSRHIDSIGWFGSASDMCAAFGSLHEIGDENVAAAMSDNDGGVALGAEWTSVWYKGGSEPGVTALGYLAENDADETYVVVVLTNAPDTDVPEMEESEARITEMMSLARGAFTLMTN
ncbi:serine hydrolase [Hoyosella subflava]|uniref:Putative beta-lactamase n=1 Tax=Hoyosella subflava (strain DSM 45089 / JCM 17490 / NBRC 109087 / DQS3-9A1) TaxID=443218 RepID=F6EHC3_HOYSD|nr:serine hydrolase [Hoyosella subflava]AEF41102.1 Putative beta-lactamase [Hoyosella subflava DQS3-9A1]